ncbi:hypothetical protein TELCIR_10508 [Teladorsagia circumcincta]|uniref:Cation-transporting P-type ATPase C-terminal domain-containing protein n=1 Tax=Teladorsagia circumcincta TaxID=45464 RepID=A0A2G9UE21_TELCI|nr:hypothetical protein TELCIR_10508 [Teladorsagia circumcincta]
MMAHGWKPFHLLNQRELWDCETLNDLEDSYGQQWMAYFRNQVLNTSLLFTTFMAMFITVTPYVTEVLKLNGIRLEDAMISVYYAFVMFVYDECRRWYLRKYPTGFIYRETYF